MDPNAKRYRPPVDDDSDSELSDVPDDALLPSGKNAFHPGAEDDDLDAEGEIDDEEEDAEGEEDEDAEGEPDDEEDEVEEEEDEEEESESEEDEGEDNYEYSEAASSARSTPRPAAGRAPVGRRPAVPVQRGRAVATTRTVGRPPAKGKPPGRKPAAPSSVSSAASGAQPTIKLTLKMPKDRLRQATSGWGSTQTSSGESSRPAKGKVPPRSSRSTRKIIEPSTSEEEEEEDEDAEGEEDEDIEMSDADASAIPDDDITMNIDDEDDQELEDEEEEEEDAEGEIDDDEVTNMGMGASGTSTPDLSKMTKRQRSRLNEVYSADLMELPASGFGGPSPANKLHLTADEQALRRAEMARRRRNLTVQKLEEEKMETINRLLNRQPPKTRGRGTKTGDATPAIQGEDGEEVEAAAETKVDKVKENLPPPGFARWTSNKDGETLFVPDSWLEHPVGRLYGGPRKKMIEIIEEDKENKMVTTA